MWLEVTKFLVGINSETLCSNTRCKHPFSDHETPQGEPARRDGQQGCLCGDCEEFELVLDIQGILVPDKKPNRLVRQLVWVQKDSTP